MDLADITQQRDEQAYQRFLAQRESTQVATSTERFCVDCGELIPKQRVISRAALLSLCALSDKGGTKMTEILEVIQKHWGIILTISGLIASLFWLKLDSRYAKNTL